MRVHWEQIVNSNVLWSTLNIGSNGENTLSIVLSLIEHCWDELASFGQSSNHSDEVIISHRTLLQVMRRKLTFALKVLTKQANSWMRVLGVFSDGMQIFWSLEFLKPT